MQRLISCRRSLKKVAVRQQRAQGLGVDFLRETDGFQFARVHVQRKVHRLGRLDGHPRRQRGRPLWRTGGGVFGC